MNFEDLLLAIFKYTYRSVNYSHHVEHYIPSTYLSYLRNLYLLILFIQFPHPLLSASGNPKSDVFFC